MVFGAEVTAPSLGWWSRWTLKCLARVNAAPSALIEIATRPLLIPLQRATGLVFGYTSFEEVLFFAHIGLLVQPR